MTWLDAVLIVLLAGSVYSGYRRGATLQVIGIAGLAVGVVAGALLAPRVAELGGSPAAAVALVFGAVLVAGAIGNMAGWAVGNRLRRRARDTPLRRVDSIGGSVVSAVALVVAIWFLALNFAEGPFPAVSRGLRRSEIVRTLDETLPPPPSLIGEARRLLSLLGFPDVFVGLPEEPSAPVEPPNGARARAAASAAQGSTVEVLADGCSRGFVNQGSGFAVASDMVVTNAHVVAGTTSQWLRAQGRDVEATVVAFDPDLDVALLRADDLGLEPLGLLRGEAERGDVGAVLGFPGGGTLTAEGAAVRAVIEPVGRNIYGSGQVRRRVYEVQAPIMSGNSGGPFVLADGTVAGLVFASSIADDEVGYAIVADEFAPMIRASATAAQPVGTGDCAR